MKINKLMAVFLLCLVIVLTFMNVSLADDTEIYVGDGTTDSDGVRPNVLFMLDTSSSMTNTDDTGITRLDRMKEALRVIINQSNNVNMGLMRFHKEGGPVLYPVKNINEPVEEVGDSASDLIIQISNSADDAEQYLTSGVVDLVGTELEMTKFAVGAVSVDLSINVSNGNDDAEESSSGSLNLSSSDLELMNESTLQKIGIRFQGVTIPAGATITSASIEFQMDETGGINDSLEIKITGHKVTDSAAFSGSNDISNRITADPTSSSVSWTPVTGLSVGDKLDTSDLSTIAQEIVNQAGWSAGNSMTFLFELKSAGSGGKRVVESENGSKAPILNISYTTGGVEDEQKIGLRFQEIMIPRGASITSAVVEFEAASDQSGAGSLTLYGEDIDDSPAFESTANNISGRTSTGASVLWSNVPAWSAGERYQSPDLSTIIQEQVNRPGWCGGQSLSVIISGTAGSLRMAESYDGSSSSAAILRVSYDPDTVPDAACINQVIQASISNGSNDVEEASDGSMSSSSSDLELVHDGSDQTIGLRFTHIAIPQGISIASARLIFSNDTSEPENGSIALTIKGENVDDSAAFTSEMNDVSTRSTTSGISWSPSAWGSSSELYSSADITSIVQTIVNRGGWEQGNAMSFIITGSGSGKRVANSFDGNASLATRLVVTVNGSVEVPVQTVRDKLLETVDNLNWKSGTPILDVMYEAALYYRGEDVLYGRTRGFGSVIGDGSLGDDYGDSKSEFTRISTPLSWEGSGSIVRPPGCTEDNPNSTDCIDENITGEATYISPIEESCQANYQILLSDGEGYGTNSVALTNSMMTDTPNCSSHDSCAEALSGFLHTVDQSDAFDEVQSIATYTIGFNLAGTDPGFLQDIAAAGGGTFNTADTASELADVFQTILSEVLTSTSSFSAPTVSVNAFNRLFHDNDVYFSTFLPSSTVRWAGNIKKYEVCEYGESDCDEGEIIGAARTPVTDSSGQFIDTAQSFWSTSVDGKEVQQGGAGSKITYPRKVHIEDGLDFVVLSEAIGTMGDTDYDATLRALLDTGLLSDSDYLDLVKWILGKDILDEDDDSDSTDNRWAFSDALHSQPLVLTYGREADGDVIKKIFIGTNDGLLRMINAETGAEEWAFMPGFIADSQNQMMTNATGDHLSGIDGNIRSLIIDTNNNGIIEPENEDGKRDKVYIYFGMRRGGRYVYALDVTPSSTLISASAITGITPSLLWKIHGGTDTGFDDLGQTWSTPQVEQIWYNGRKKTVVMFAGGYHPGQDTAYGTSSYGNAIYVVDALDGALLWRGDKTGIVTGSEAVAEFSEMDYPIPSDLALLDTNADGAVNRMYVGDTGGQVWRIDFENKAGGMKGTGARLAYIVEPDAFGVIAAEAQRKFFYAPDVAMVKDFEFSATAPYDLLVMVSGDRSSPNSKTVHDRIYMFRDYVISGTIYDETLLPAPDNGEPDLRRFTVSLTEDDLYDATENLIQDEDGSSRSDDALDEVAILKQKDGWYVSLVEGTSDWVGEKGLSEPVILNGIVVLTTYLPSGEVVEDELCAAPIEGSGRIYGMNILNAASVFPDWSGDTDTFVRADRIYSHSLTGIPSSPVVRMTESGPKILVGSGGGITQVDPKIDLQVNRSYWKEL